MKEKEQPMQSEDAPGRTEPREWRLAFVALGATLLVILALYRETALSMAVIWARSDTFAHGFLVPLISLWLAWRTRRSLVRIKPRANLWTLPLFAVAGFAWLLGEMASVAPLSQFALTAMVILSVPATLGIPVARLWAFPLGFLLFAVPFGEFALPVLMEWTATATVWGLRLSGVPVYREGLHFVIPSGSWSVVEACSGVRYLIASLMVGTLFAYLSYRSTRRRLVFVGVAFLVPILANWLRAYMIVMLGHVSGNKLAVGVDHLIYGWLFFGIVIMLMFWIGSRWREDFAAGDDAPSVVIPTRPVNADRRNSVLAVLMVSVVVAAWPFAEWRIVANAKPDVSGIGPVEPAAGWTPTASPLADWTPRYGNPSATVSSTFSRGERKVGLFMAFYRNQGDTRKLVSSSNVLVHSSDYRWLKVNGASRPLIVGDRSLNVRTAELRGTDGDRLIVWQWYWVNGRLTASDYLAKAYTALNRLFGQGDDSAVIIVYADKAADDSAERLLQDFVDAHLPAIEKLLQSVRDGHG